ncbi:hypothetical protein [Duganella sp. Root1480D1]|uniref:hypothetical protein n=1 Tax=Duganella sp. Root1480D1 TaxID=1736471 RepID=UPI000AD3FE5B|nr:hypothetical protein [Duganella sp. Root1480D1]
MILKLQNKTERKIDGSEEFGPDGWKKLRLETPRMKLNAIWRDGEPPLMFGVEGELDHTWIEGFAKSLQQIDAGQLVGRASALPDHWPFECCGFVIGKDRKLLRGIEDDDAFVQAIPMFWCELRPDNTLPPLDAFRSWTNIFDMRRSPQPWFEYRMKGGKSGLNVAKWRPERYSTLQGFVRILSAEDSSWLEIKNRHGEILRLPDQEGWSGAEQRVDSHLQSAGQGTPEPGNIGR